MEPSVEVSAPFDPAPKWHPAAELTSILTVYGMPKEFVYTRILPGTAAGVIRVLKRIELRHFFDHLRL